ncbi:hypothetical protein BV140_1258 [Haemophilus influenzae]|nr:hypothetical protein BV083_1200 [Haemophilus influenzae]AVJ07029.1 hypothetical protein BV139_1256 [Haemophilus influenzae]AVJ08863.1 hypothetical protein BV140_1258 [Haemophilus influenzae]
MFLKSAVIFQSQKHVQNLPHFFIETQHKPSVPILPQCAVRRQVRGLIQND